MAVDEELMDAGLGGCTWMEDSHPGERGVGQRPSSARGEPQGSALPENTIKPGFLHRPYQLSGSFSSAIG